MIFFVLKVTHVVDWSWLWVLAPMWTPTAFVLGLCGVIFIPTIMISGIAYFASKKKYRKSQEKTIDNDFHVKLMSFFINKIHLFLSYVIDHF